LSREGQIKGGAGLARPFTSKSGSFETERGTLEAHPAWAAILRAAERIPDVARLRFDSDAAAACAIRTNRHVACVRATADGKPRHLLPSSTTPVHVVWPLRRR
jgi:hypothetical protein